MVIVIAKAAGSKQSRNSYKDWIASSAKPPRNDVLPKVVTIVH